MRRLMITTAMVLGLAAASNPANAVGCFTGAIAGAVAGHMAHHGLLGAVGGCIAGHEWRRHQMRQSDLQTRDAYVQERQQQDPNFKDPWAQSDSSSDASSNAMPQAQPQTPTPTH